MNRSESKAQAKTAGFIPEDAVSEDSRDEARFILG